jgi:hypothetical protein
MNCPGRYFPGLPIESGTGPTWKIIGQQHYQIREDEAMNDGILGVCEGHNTCLDYSRKENLVKLGSYEISRVLPIPSPAPCLCQRIEGRLYEGSCEEILRIAD